MTTILPHSKLTRADAFVPGSSGWSTHDLNDPSIERIWEREHYELIEGVIATMPPAYFDGGLALERLAKIVKDGVETDGKHWGVGYEVDVILSAKRVVKPDAIFLSPTDMANQKRENAKRGKKKLTYGRIVIAPTLVVESLSMDHESHDSVTKRRWYAEFGIPNYWLLNAYTRTLQCLILDGSEYKLDAAGKGNATLKPTAFPRLVIPLKQLWS
jgi:Uma2 family endonuclease